MAYNRITYVNGKIATPKINLGIPLNTAILTSIPGDLSSIDTDYSIATRSLTSIILNSKDLYTGNINLSDFILMPAQGGTILNDFALSGNLNVFGKLSALSAFGTISTIFTNTCALSVVNPRTDSSPNPTLFLSANNLQPALIVKDSLIVAINGNTGIKTLTPNEELTVQGDISASNVIYTQGGNSGQWNELVTLLGGVSATFGAQGTQGSQGNTNIQGLQGEIGLQGLMGLLHFPGIQGFDGVQGVRGQKGTTGSVGTLGEQGIQGAQGIQGTEGNDGDLGTLGTQGAQGAQGFQGLQGTQGLTGNTSERGNQGVAGNQGAQGARGQDGNSGAQGTTGAQGLSGIKGKSGLDANQGVQGAQNIQGLQGDIGNQNIQGLQGATNSFGAQGVQGRQGTQGRQGSQGLAGEQPAQAITGAQGQHGEEGAQGLQGRRGPTHNQGIQGAQGRGGEDGETLVPGNQGAQGVFNVLNLQGTEGFQGISTGVGRQGAQGIRGERGADNFQGIQGLDTLVGNQGTRGTQGLNMVYFDVNLGLVTLLQGIQGAEGYNAPAQNTGPQGARGETSTQGTDGNQGRQGRQGILSFRGERGEIGAQGNTGIQGIDTFSTGPQGVRHWDGAIGLQGARSDTISNANSVEHAPQPQNNTIGYGMLRLSTSSNTLNVSPGGSTPRFKTVTFTQSNVSQGRTEVTLLNALEALAYNGVSERQITPTVAGQIRLTNGTYHLLQIASNASNNLNATVFEADTTSSKFVVFTVEVKYFSNFEVTWGFSPRWENNTAPAQTKGGTQSAPKTDIYTFIGVFVPSLGDTRFYGFQNIANAS